MCQAESHERAYLPRCVGKDELRRYFGVPYKYLWSSLITDDLIEEWGGDIDQIKKQKRLTPQITRRIYLHFGITDLKADYSSEIAAELEVNQDV
ncbi:MAG: hypothetical protein AAF741_15605 [Bacteroidota bacterium]